MMIHLRYVNGTVKNLLAVLLWTHLKVVYDVGPCSELTLVYRE